MPDKSETVLPTDSRPEVRIDKLSLSEYREGLIKHAMRSFDEVTEGTKRLERKDLQVVEEIDHDINRVAQVEHGQIFREETGPEVQRQRLSLDQSRSEIVGTLKPRLSQISSETKALGLSQAQYRPLIESILKDAATEPDPYKAYQKSIHALDAFKSATEALARKREEQKGDRNRIVHTTDENEIRARHLLAQVTDQVRKDLSGGLFDRYKMSTRRLAETVTSAMSQLSSEDRKFLDEIDHQSHVFKTVVINLLQPDPTVKTNS
jgi:hypothetical protein